MGFIESTEHFSIKIKDFQNNFEEQRDYVVFKSSNVLIQMFHTSNAYIRSIIYERSKYHSFQKIIYHIEKNFWLKKNYLFERKFKYIKYYLKQRKEHNISK